MNSANYATLPDRIIEHQDASHRVAMREGSRRFALALGIEWPCEHKRVPENTHTVAGRAECKTCRRRRWRRGFRLSCARIAARREAIAKGVATRSISKIDLENHILHFPENGKLTLDTLKREVAFIFDIDQDELTFRKRATDVIRDARSVIYRILRERGLSLPTIGRAMNGKDHSTVLYALRSFPRYAKENPLVEMAYLNLKDRAANDAA